MYPLNYNKRATDLHTLSDIFLYCNSICNLFVAYWTFIMFKNGFLLRLVVSLISIKSLVCFFLDFNSILNSLLSFLFAYTKFDW